MLTLFTTPKPFKGHIAAIQRNALQSWALLRPRPEIIIFGDEEGTAAIAREFNLCHILDIARNEYGTPLISDIFTKAKSVASFEQLCYINADVILMRDFGVAVQLIPFRQFIMSGQRWNVDIEHDWDYSETWESRLRAQVKQHGRLYTPSGMDYFVFPRNLEIEFPPFSVGRIGWDNWFVSYARKHRIAVVDATQMVMAVHQNHEYAHIPTGTSDVQVGNEAWLRGPEAQQNLDLAGSKAVLDGDRRKLYTLRDATWKLTASGRLRRSFPLRGLLYRHLKRFLD